MSCCGGGNRHTTIYQVRQTNGKITRYGTEGEAWAAAKSLNKDAPGSATVEVKKTK